MYEKKSSFPVINYIVSFAGAALLTYLTYEAVTSMWLWGFLVKLLLWFLFDGIVGIQVLLLALSMGKRDRNPELNYEGMILFNKIMLVIYAIYYVVFNIYLIMNIVDIVRGVVRV